VILARIGAESAKPWMEGSAYRSSTPEQAEVARPDLRVWHDRSKIRGRFIGIGNGVLVAKAQWRRSLKWTTRRRFTIGADDRICCNQPNDNPRARIPKAERIPRFVQYCKHLRRQEWRRQSAELKPQDWRPFFCESRPDSLGASRIARGQATDKCSHRGKRCPCDHGCLAMSAAETSEPSNCLADRLPSADLGRQERQRPDHDPERSASIAWAMRMPMLRMINVPARAEAIRRLLSLSPVKGASGCTVKTIHNHERCCRAADEFEPQRPDCNIEQPPQQKRFQRLGVGGCTSWDRLYGHARVKRSPSHFMCVRATLAPRRSRFTIAQIGEMIGTPSSRYRRCDAGPFFAAVLACRAC
jgi:hypothetical protein